MNTDRTVRFSTGTLTVYGGVLPGLRGGDTSALASLPWRADVELITGSGPSRKGKPSTSRGQGGL